MPDISRSLDPISDLVISLTEESTPYHCHIFCLPQTFQLLKINTFRKSMPYISVKPFHGARRNVSFFTLKGLSPKDIHTELESVYRDETLCVCTVYKWHKRFMQGRTELFDDPWSNDLCRMISPTPFAQWFRDSLLLRTSIFVSHLQSQRALACASYTTFSVWKFLIYDGFRALSMMLKKPNRCHFPWTLWRLSTKIKRTTLLRL
jgi:hypothetical protein